MKFSRYLLDNINLILLFITYTLVISFLLLALSVEVNVVIIFNIINLFFTSSIFIFRYIRKSKYLKELDGLMDNLEERYLISEVMETPKTEEYKFFHKLLKRSNKSMLEKITKVENERKEYQEYIESWVHEIKLPITSGMLKCNNNKSEVTRKIQTDLEEIDNYIEQVLFYARSENVSQDYIIKETDLEGVINNVIAKNKQILLQNNIKIETEGLDKKAFTDEKWITFMLNQIIINSVKYRKEENPEIKIYCIENHNNVLINIRDNGIGIKQSEVDRVFEKGFTGSNGRKDKKSTGIGLYLCKKLSKLLGIDMKVQSKINEFTEITLILPKGKLVKM